MRNPTVERALPRLGTRLPLADYMGYVRSLGPRMAYWIVLDQLIPTLTHYISYAELARWFERTNLSDVRILPRTGNSWRGLGRLRGT